MGLVAQVDGVLMSHPQVAEAVAFGCPDEKYGEIVAAAVVPHKPVSDTAAFAKDIQKQAGQKIAAFKLTCPCKCSYFTHTEVELASGRLHRQACRNSVTVLHSFNGSHGCTHQTV